MKDKKIYELKNGTDHYYINKKKIYLLVCDYKTRLKEYQSKNDASTSVEKIPQPDNELIFSIYKMINRELGKPNYRNYTFHDEMRGLAIIDCLRAIDLFDPTKSDNVFSYFWGTIQNAFKRVIIAEKRQIEIRNKLIIEKLDEIANDPDIEDDVVNKLRENMGFEHVFRLANQDVNNNDQVTISENEQHQKKKLAGTNKGRRKKSCKIKFSFS